MKPTGRVIATEIYYLPAVMRVPLKFGAEVTKAVDCVRVKMTIKGADSKRAEGWGETPLSAAWAWTSKLGWGERENSMKAFCGSLAGAWANFDAAGHPIDVGYQFSETVLDRLLNAHNQSHGLSEDMPHLAALICNSAFDIALHDAYGHLVGKPIYDTYNSDYMSKDLAAYLTPAEGTAVSFAGKYPCDFLVDDVPTQLPAWHLVGGLDPLDDSERTGSEPDDGYPVTLDEWIKTDGLNCLKIKLRGNDAAWDYERIVRVGDMAATAGVDWLTTDFNCTVTDPDYVNAILDKLQWEHPRTYGMILYVEQPFPYDLEANQIDVHSVSARKPLFMDESAHDWRFVKMGYGLGWTGVALKTCKTQTGALLSLCWAKAHGMTLMVQDLTNPMLAMIPHVLLAAHAGTIMGVEVNAMQFYPATSAIEEKVHPKIYQRRGGKLDFSSLQGAGFGYRVDEIGRGLPKPAGSFGG